MDNMEYKQTDRQINKWIIGRIYRQIETDKRKNRKVGKLEKLRTGRARRAFVLEEEIESLPQTLIF